jgi:phosphoribosylformylglycinamidine synthase II
VPYRVQVTARDDPEGRRVVAGARSLGIGSVTGCRFSRVHHLAGDLSASDVDRICREVLVDPVVDDLLVGDAPPAPGRVIEVVARPGVTDTDARALERAALELGLGGVRAVSMRRYELDRSVPDHDMATLIKRLLANDTIELHVEGQARPDFAEPAPGHPVVVTVPVDGLSGDELTALSRERQLSLDAAEMGAIQAHFRAEGRPPTDAELETLAQTWSEHCVHKTFRAEIDMIHVAADGAETETRLDGLLAMLRAVTDELAPAWLKSAFVDNAGIVAFDDQHDLAMKVETHNHPSALEPFGGANTGVGGVVRDVMGVSARPIACTDVLCFGPADLPDRDLPPGAMHPRRIRDGVIAGVGDYGNKLGLPTVNGAVLYDRGYIGNPLVYCGAVGLLPAGSHPTQPRPRDRIVAIGGRTGRDGIHGATFSSAGMDATTAHVSGAAVQIGDPITQKGCIEVVERARDRGLYTAITDCGAGGFSSAVGEMGAELGAEVDISVAPLKYEGLEPWEIWLSEAQERMVMAVPPAETVALAELCDAWDVEMTDLGEFTGSGRLVVRHGAQQVIDIPMSFLHDGLPRRRMTGRWNDPVLRSPRIPDVDLASFLLDLLAHPDVASKQEVIRTYDHEVRAGTVVRPLVGIAGDGPGDAAVLKPLGTWHHDAAVVLSVGINPRLGRIDPWTMALSVVDEAVRNLVAVGGDPDRVALLDNFCWGDPTKPDRLGSLVRAVQGCVEAARRYRMPFISGKDSLFNEFEGEAIPGTLLISALGIVPDLHQVVASAVTTIGDDLWLVGEGAPGLGGSLAAEVLGLDATDVPAPVTDPLPRYRAIHELIRAGHAHAAHDCSEGGLAVTLAEMAIGGRLGVRATVADSGNGSLATLVNEAPGRVVLATDREARDDVERVLGGLGRRIGEVSGGDSITIAVGSPGEGTGAARLEIEPMAVRLDDAVEAFSGSAQVIAR